MREGIIYKVSCSENNTFLYGSTVRGLYKRKSEYIALLKKGKYYNRYLQNSYDKYGKDSIRFEIVQENIPENLLCFVEDIWIGANCSRIEDKQGGFNMRNATTPEISNETKILMGNSRRGKPRSEEIKKKISEAHLGKKLSESHIKKIKERVISEEWKKNMLEGQKDKWVSVIQFDKNTLDIIKIWDSFSHAAKELDVSPQSIFYAAKNITKTCKGFRWSFKNKDVIPKDIKIKLITTNDKKVFNIKSKNTTKNFSKQVYQYSLGGEFIKSFFSVAEAAKCYNCLVTSIASSARSKGKNKSNGYLWSYEKYEKIEKYRDDTGKYNIRPIIQMDLEGNFIKEWKSITYVSKVLKLSTGNIHLCLKGKRNKTGGFKWKYADQPKINKK